MNTTKKAYQLAPVLTEGRVYLAHDRFVCTECAGSSALFTGRTICGAIVTPVTAQDVREWATYDLGPLACECGRVTA